MLSLCICIVTSCASYKNITIEDVRGSGVKPSSGGKMVIDLEARVNNPTCRKVHLKKLELDVFRNGSLFATLNTPNTVTVPRKSNDFQPIPIELRLRNILATLMTLDNMNINDFTVEGEIKVSSFPMYKTIKIPRQSIQTFSAQFGDILTPILSIQNR